MTGNFMTYRCPIFTRFAVYSKKTKNFNSYHFTKDLIGIRKQHQHNLIDILTSKNHQHFNRNSQKNQLNQMRYQQQLNLIQLVIISKWR